MQRELLENVRQYISDWMRCKELVENFLTKSFVDSGAQARSSSLTLMGKSAKQMSHLEMQKLRYNI